MPRVPSSYVATRQSLHAVAEHVMAAAQYASIGKIGLRPHPHGFRTQEFDAGLLAVERGYLMGSAIDGATLRDLGAIDIQLPYDVATPFDDRPLSVETSAATELGDFFSFVDLALREISPEDASPIQIWPEHFDIATDFGAVNYGGSPGDDTYPEPYLYVGPWDRSDTASFDDPWGWTLHFSDSTSVDDAIAFFQRGKHLFG